METANLNVELEKKNKDMSQLFRKYLVPRTPGKTNIEESKQRPPLLISLSRPPSFLEKKMFSALRCESEKLSTVSCADKALKPQLTIFYDGGVSVYDNVSAEKAKEVMLILGGERVSEQEFISKPQKGRKHSLQCFMEKRRDRMIDKSPYAPACVPSNRD